MGKYCLGKKFTSRLRHQAALLEDSDNETRAIDSHFVQFLVLHVYKESRKHFCNMNMGKQEKILIFIDVYAIIRTPMGSDLMSVLKSGHNWVGGEIYIWT